MGDDNIVQFGAVKGGKTDDPALPFKPYVVTDIDGEDFFSSGFLVFTSHHIAVMRDEPGVGAVPVLVVPLHRVASAELLEESED